MKYKTSPEALDAMKQFEGCVLDSYKCPGGVMTIGYGHTGKDVEPGDRITIEYADMLFEKDIKNCEDAVNVLDVCRTQGQFDALVDFVYNLGIRRLKDSTLLIYIKLGCEDDKIQSEFLRWCYAKGKRLPGLEKRCQWRAQRWVS